MPFHPSALGFEVLIDSKDGVLDFEKSAAHLTYSGPHHDCPPDEFRVVSVQRGRTGEELQNFWSLREDTRKELSGLRECLPGVRFFRLVFDGNAFTKHLCEKKLPVQLLYKSILGMDEVRLHIKVGDTICYLRLNLRYKVKIDKATQQPAATGQATTD